jgi:hypothetical protein
MKKYFIMLLLTVIISCGVKPYKANEKSMTQTEYV